MAPNSSWRALSAIIAGSILLALGPVVAWSQPAETWSQKLQGDWCDAERGCTHWWTHYLVLVDSDDSILVRYRERPFAIFYGKIEEPIGRWVIKAKITSGKHAGQEFEAAVSNLEYLKELVQGKIKGALKAKIQSADIEGIRLQEMKGIAISEATVDEPRIDGPKIDEPRIHAPKVDKPKVGDVRIDETKMDAVKIDGVTLEKAEIKEPETEGTTIKRAKEIKAESLSADKVEAKNLEAKKLQGKALEAKELEGKRIKGTRIVGKRIEGGNQLELSIPIQISEATIEGIARPKKDKEKKGDEAGDDDEGQGKKRISIDGKIKGKIAGSAGPIDLSGDFEGTFTALVQAIVKGSYAVPPHACSEAGSPLSEEEKADLKIRRAAKRGVLEDRPGRYLSETEEKDTKLFKPFFAELLIDAVKKSQLVVDAMPTNAPRPAEPHTRGKFMRKVSGTVSVIEPATLTIELPPLPVLDHKCSVIDELPKRTLKLVKQHDALR